MHASHEQELQRPSRPLSSETAQFVPAGASTPALAPCAILVLKPPPPPFLNKYHLPNISTACVRFLVLISGAERTLEQSPRAALPVCRA
jgi:hypothetical protein